MKCRYCKSELKHVFVDLNYSPISNDMLTETRLEYKENYFPLKVEVCHKCFLVQHSEYKKAIEIFDDKYTYFSSYSKSWLKHSKNYVDMMMKRFSFDENSLILEIASNDGYLLQYFLDYGVPVMGIDPTTNTAIEAEKKGVKTIIDFFSSDFVKNNLETGNLEKANLIIGNNVFAHVPDINDFVEGLKLGLKEEGIITLEFPHLLNLIKDVQFDTIYHEHFSYLSLIAVKQIVESRGLEIFDVEELNTHGGSLRVYLKHIENKKLSVSDNVLEILTKEIEFGLNKIKCYEGFQNRVDEIKYDTLTFLINERRNGKKIIGYGAASKGNTLLNYCGIKGRDLINFVVDASPYKQNKYLPGSHIPVYDEKKLKKYKPDYVIILPWNLKDEIIEQLFYIKEWGGKFVIFIPKLNVF